MQTPEQKRGKCRHGITPLARRLSLRIRCARPGHTPGQDQETHSGQTQILEWIDELAESSAVRANPRCR